MDVKLEMDEGFYFSSHSSFSSCQSSDDSAYSSSSASIKADPWTPTSEASSPQRSNSIDFSMPYSSVSSINLDDMTPPSSAVSSYFQCDFPAPTGYGHMDNSQTQPHSPFEASDGLPATPHRMTASFDSASWTVGSAQSFGGPELDMHVAATAISSSNHSHHHNGAGFTHSTSPSMPLNLFVDSRYHDSPSSSPFPSANHTQNAALPHPGAGNACSLTHAGVSTSQNLASRGWSGLDDSPLVMFHREEVHYDGGSEQAMLHYPPRARLFSSATQQPRAGIAESSSSSSSSTRTGKKPGLRAALVGSSASPAHYTVIPKSDNPCPYEGCKKRYKRSEHLKRHVRTVHESMESAVYYCQFCPVNKQKHFCNRRDNFGSHLRLHTNPSKGKSSRTQYFPGAVEAYRKFLEATKQRKSKLKAERLSSSS